MRGREAASAHLFSYVRLEERVPSDHPRRPIRALADEVLAGLNERFESLYSGLGRPSIPLEMLLRAPLLQVFFSVRSERMLMEQIDDNLLFRWFVGLEIDASVWHPTVFTHNRDRLLETEGARAFLSGLLALKPVERLLSSEHFSVDGTMIDAWASMKSFRPKDGSGEPPGPSRNGERDFRKETDRHRVRHEARPKEEMLRAGLDELARFLKREDPRVARMQRPRAGCARGSLGTCGRAERGGGCRPALRPGANGLCLVSALNRKRAVRGSDAGSGPSIVATLSAPAQSAAGDHRHTVRRCVRDAWLRWHQETGWVRTRGVGRCQAARAGAGPRTG